MTKTLAVNPPTDPKASLITLAYVVFTPASVKRMRKSTETSASTATIIIKAMAGNTPRTFRIAGIDMIPEPIMLVATLSTAPGMVPGTGANFDPVKRGMWTPADGDIPVDGGEIMVGEFEKEMWSWLFMLPSIYIYIYLEKINTGSFGWICVYIHKFLFMKHMTIIQDNWLDLRLRS